MFVSVAQCSIFAPVIYISRVCYYCRYYAPALGFLMFAVGVNSTVKDFVEAIKRPDAIAAGYIGQFVIKPLLGFLFGTLAVAVLNLPTALGKKLIHAFLYALEGALQNMW